MSFVPLCNASHIPPPITYAGHERRKHCLRGILNAQRNGREELSIRIMQDKPQYATGIHPDVYPPDNCHIWASEEDVIWAELPCKSDVWQSLDCANNMVVQNRSHPANCHLIHSMPPVSGKFTKGSEQYNGTALIPHALQHPYSAVEKVDVLHYQCYQSSRPNGSR